MQSYHFISAQPQDKVLVDLEKPDMHCPADLRL